METLFWGCGLRESALGQGFRWYRRFLGIRFCAAFLCAQSGIQNTIDNSAAYIQGWAKAINRDKRLVVIAASQGQKAADYILGRQADGQAA